MTKKEICLSNPTIAYWTGIGGVEIKSIEYSVDDYIYCIANAWYSKKSYHRVKINYTATGNSYITIHGYKIPLDECLTV